MSRSGNFTAGSKAAMDTCKFLRTMGRLKDTPRTGWVDNGIPHPESISDHMYRMSLMCMMCPDPSLNRDRLIRMALCHDTGESIIGDVSPKMKVAKEVKAKMEADAVADLSQLVASDPDQGFAAELQALFLEYEAQETAEARFVKDMDLLEMIVQAYDYEALNKGKDLQSFFDSGKKIQHPWAKAIYDTLVSTRPYLTRGEGGYIEPEAPRTVTVDDTTGKL